MYTNVAKLIKVKSYYLREYLSWDNTYLAKHLFIGAVFIELK